MAFNGSELFATSFQFCFRRYDDASVKEHFFVFYRGGMGEPNHVGLNGFLCKTNCLLCGSYWKTLCSKLKPFAVLRRRAYK